MSRELFTAFPISPGVAEGPIKHLGQSKIEFIRNTYKELGVDSDSEYTKEGNPIKVLASIGKGCVVVTFHLTVHFYADLLSEANAFILEEGSAGAHAAALARELGTPAVVLENPDHFLMLKEGMVVTVNGNTGVVSQE